MSAAWEQFARTRGLEYVPPRALRARARKPSLLLSGPVVRGVIGGVVVHVRGARSSEGLLSRVQGKASVPANVRLVATCSRAPVLESIQGDLDTVSLIDPPFDARFSVRASDPALAVRVLAEGVRASLVDFAAQREPTLVYDRGLAVLYWRPHPGRGLVSEEALLDRALELVVATCCFQAGTSAYR